MPHALKQSSFYQDDEELDKTVYELLHETGMTII